MSICLKVICNQCGKTTEIDSRTLDVTEDRVYLQTRRHQWLLYSELNTSYGDYCPDCQKNLNLNLK